MRETLGGLLERTARVTPGKLALVYGERSLTYGALDRLANRFAQALQAAGLGDGERLALMGRNSLDYAAAYFGAAKAGLISAHFSWRYTAAELATVLARTAASAMAIDASLMPLLAEAPSSTRPPLIIAMEDAGAGAPSFAAFLARGTETPPAGPRPDDPAVIVFTSGTTGRAKGALASHASRVLSSIVAAEDFALGPADVVLVAAPLYHAAGLFTWFQTAIAVGATAVLQANWNIRDFIAAVDRHGVTGAFMVPTQIALLLDSPGFDAKRLRGLRLIVYGGAPMPRALIERAEAALPWVSFVQNYGQTETGPLFSMQPAERRQHPDAIGRPNRRIEIGLFAAPGRLALPGEIGELCTRGAHLMSGYFRDEEETRDFFRSADGWGWTGDLAVADETGYITLQGRAKDTIIAGGVNIYPAEIEQILLRHAAVAECAAFGIPDPTWGELPAAEVVLRRAAAVTADEIRDFCAAGIAPFKRPRLIVLVDALPLTPGGKLDRKAIRRRNAPGAL